MRRREGYFGERRVWDRELALDTRMECGGSGVRCQGEDVGGWGARHQTSNRGLGAHRSWVAIGRARFLMILR